MEIKKELILREVAGERVLVPTGSTVATDNGLFMLSGTAAYIWEILPDVSDENEIVKALLEKYDIEEAQATADTIDFLNKLCDFGII